MRPIDADALKELVIETLERIAKMPAMNHEEMHVIAACRMLCEMIDDAPAIDYAPVMHGEWNEVEGYDGDCHYQCSLCGEEWTLNDGTPVENNMNYCPRCGARMDGKPI